MAIPTSNRSMNLLQDVLRRLNVPPYMRVDAQVAPFEYGNNHLLIQWRSFATVHNAFTNDWVTREYALQQVIDTSVVEDANPKVIMQIIQNRVPEATDNVHTMLDQGWYKDDNAGPKVYFDDWMLLDAAGQGRMIERKRKYQEELDYDEEW